MLEIEEFITATYYFFIEKKFYKRHVSAFYLGGVAYFDDAAGRTVAHAPNMWWWRYFNFILHIFIDVSVSFLPILHLMV